ncbi:hypothetical protein Pmani_025738 [Petrolisthes manimaculis]|uniref:Uncharacterized protein n=1 Tax=Petrolisthes manimaculis TaxID=1843537 RepID=A0AAE1P4V2_9EUCA|nr:hypothetical protein Pmani_025738 [Petrolisthes manimaculis]
MTTRQLFITRTLSLCIGWCVGIKGKHGCIVDSKVDPNNYYKCNDGQRSVVRSRTYYRHVVVLNQARKQWGTSGGGKKGKGEDTDDDDDDQYEEDDDEIEEVKVPKTTAHTSSD